MGQKPTRKPSPDQQCPWIPEVLQKIHMHFCAFLEWIVLSPCWNEKYLEQSCIRNLGHLLYWKQFSRKPCGFRSDQIRQNTYSMPMWPTLFQPYKTQSFNSPALCVSPTQCTYACVPYDSHNGQLLTVLHCAVGVCVGGLQRGKREGALNYLCITEVLFKVSLFSYFFLHFSLYFHSFLFYISFIF